MQCARCVQETPDVMPFVRHFSKRSFGDETALLWDCCEEDWFALDNQLMQRRMTPTVSLLSSMRP